MLLELREEIVVSEKEPFHSAIKDDDLDLALALARYLQPFDLMCEIAVIHNVRNCEYSVWVGAVVKEIIT